MKKIFTLFFALVATTALWAEDFSVDGIYYNILYDKTNEVEVTYQGDYDLYYDEYSGSVSIPETVTYDGTTYSVTSIGDDAFYWCESLTSITIPNSVTSIGYWAFAKCSGLTSITIPNSVTNIGNYAFYYCYNLTSITIPNSVTSIGASAFRDCFGLTSITIPNSVTSIGDYAFEGCTSLTSITIPNSVTSIGDDAFCCCSGLTSIVVEEGNTMYDSRENCNAIIETASNTLVAGCQNTTIPNSVTSIGNWAFYRCFSLTSITIPNSVTSIGNYAFCDCFSLTSITIPNSVTSIGNSVFSGCSGLTAPVYNAHWFVYMPESFEGAYSIPDGIKQIAGGAFAYSGLTSVTIGSGITSIGASAFEGCSGLTSITIPNSVTSIGDGAFYGCSGLTSITIPNSVTSIGYSAFEDCSGLTSIVVEEGNTMYDSRENCNAIIETASNTLITGCQNTTIPNSVTSIGYDAFSGCSGLTSITIPNSVTSIGNSAFYWCESLTSVTIPNSVTTIGDEAFYYCSSLTSVTCKAVNLPEMGEGVFWYAPTTAATLYVPEVSLELYQAAEQWKEFGTILPIAQVESDLENIGSDNGYGVMDNGKILRNGQLIIIRDGVEYNTLGQAL